MKQARIHILGSGTSTGVPSIGCQCEVCTSADPRDRRLRASALIECGNTRILIDCGPDFRAQALKLPFARIDGVLITHEHYDHVGGIDDLRPFCLFGTVTLHAEQYVIERLRTRLPYCFAEHAYPGVPKIDLKRVSPGLPFRIGDAKVLPLRVLHGQLPILGYRIGNIGYITDMLSMPEESYQILKGIDVLIVNALRPSPHHSHQTVSNAIEVAKRIAARETFFIHMSHDIGLHSETEKTFPPHVHLAYDGLIIETVSR